MVVLEPPPARVFDIAWLGVTVSTVKAGGLIKLLFGLLFPFFFLSSSPARGTSTLLELSWKSTALAGVVDGELFRFKAGTGVGRLSTYGLRRAIAEMR